MLTQQKHEEHFAELQSFFAELESLPAAEDPEPNLFSLAGPGHHENRLSDLMALFMGSHPAAPRWLGKALVTSVCRKGGFQPELAPEALDNLEWSDVVAEREVGIRDAESGAAKRLDLVISNDDFVVGVEHKVWASAGHNPFGCYEELLESYGRDHAAMCVLRPHGYAEDVPSGWLVVSYHDLLQVAYELYGKEVATTPHDKWHVFYQELLKHIDSIANPYEAKTMDQKELEFSLKHFHYLREAASYLKRLENELIQEGKGQVSASLEIAESDVKHSVNNWTGSGQVALRFFPPQWGGETQVCLVFYIDTEESEADETIGFYVRGYIDARHEDVSLESIEQNFQRQIPAAKNADFAFYRDGEGTWYENNKRYLALDAWPRDYTKAGAMAALGDLAKWVNERLNADMTIR